MAGPFSQRWTLEEHTPRETGGMQGRQANGTFSRCLQANNISVLACPRALPTASTLEAWCNWRLR